MTLNDLFDYGYKIYQNQDHFKFSIDSILLAEFVQPKKGQKRLIDLCSGNLPIPIILNDKFKDKLSITACELQPEIYELGIKTLEFNNLSSINYLNNDIKNIVDIYKNNKFDIITCNPPYFKVFNPELINEDQVKAIARHEITINLEEIIAISAKIINNNGSLYLVHRPERLTELVIILNKYNFGIKKIVPVYSDKKSDACLFLVEASFNSKNYVKIHTPIFINDYKSYKNIFWK